MRTARLSRGGGGHRGTLNIIAMCNRARSLVTKSDVAILPGRTHQFATQIPRARACTSRGRAQML